MFAGGKHDAAEGHHAALLNRLADHREGLLSNLAVRYDVIGTINVEVVDLVPGCELIDVDGARRLDVDCFEVRLCDFDIAFALADLVPFDDLVRGHDIAGLGVNLLEMK